MAQRVEHNPLQAAMAALLVAEITFAVPQAPQMLCQAGWPGWPERND